ncbi:PAS domain-containing protein [Jannaschia donghaensis]|uniref:histidine kinase n=1 Tax=Jannaschia donghaensis TaxID=420998 RepID=A0A0M6YKW7_9RHOB|nr:PAS domain-containing protein [Jannaschia donghaensis]CTQ50998.1 Blue-light-activated histidine kinase 2 [Jannaschia donghaensis]
MTIQKHDAGVYLRAGQDILADLPLSMVLTDPTRPDNPIVYVNRAFEELSGYSSSFAVGRNCRFMQGEGTDPAAVAQMSRAIEAREATTVTLENVHADGTKFRNRLMISPVFNDNGEIYAFVGIQSALTDAKPEVLSVARDFDAQLSEMQHRVKNHLQMISSLIRLEARGKGELPEKSTLARRVEALALLYEEFTHAPRGGFDRDYDVVSAGSYASRVAATVGALDGRSDVRMTIDTDPVYMRSDQAGRMGLLISEVLSNTFQHAFGNRAEGLVTVSLKQHGGDRVRLIIADDGMGMGDSDWPKSGNLGAQIVQGLVAQLGADLNVVTTDAGTLITVDLENPIDTSINEDGVRVLADTDGRRDGTDRSATL